MTALAPNLISTHRILTTLRVDRQLLGIPVQCVRGVIPERPVTRIPLAPAEVHGTFQLHGHIVTVIDLRRRLKLAPKTVPKPSMFVMVERGGEHFALRADAAGEVLTLDETQIEHVPSNLGMDIREIATEICRLPQELLVLANVDALLTIPSSRI